MLTRLAEADFPGTEALLVKATRSPDAGLVASALWALSRSRFQAALKPILDIACSAEQAEIRALAIAAALASRPDSTDLFRDLWPYTPAAAHWRWVLAGRLRDVREAPALVALATDSTQDWKLRRLAILAAGRLPFAVAMEAIVPVILNTPVALAEESPRFQTHVLVVRLVKVVGKRSLMPPFLHGRDGFVRELAPIYEAWASNEHDPMPASDAVGWLWDRLENHGFARDPRTIGNVVNELHVPLLHAAALLVLRRHGRRDDLFTAFEQAPTHWLRMRALRALCRGTPLSVEHEQRAQALIDGAPPTVKPLLSNIFATRPRPERPAPIPQSAGTLVPTAALRLTFEQAQAFRISMERIDAKPIVVELDEQQLRALVVDLDPASDTEWRPALDAKPARVSLSETSWRLRGGFALEQTSPHNEQRSALRPAVAAANRFGIHIPWHRAALAGGALRNLYADRFFASLGAQNDRDASSGSSRKRPSSSFHCWTNRSASIMCCLSSTNGCYPCWTGSSNPDMACSSSSCAG